MVMCEQCWGMFNKISSLLLTPDYVIFSGGARLQNLGGHLRGKLIFWGGKIEVLKRYCYLPMPLSQDFRPPPRRFAPLSSLPFRIFAPPPIYAMWFIQIISWYVHLISALHAWEFNSAKLKLFCLFWNVLLEYWQVLPFRDLQTNIETVKNSFMYTRIH
jgi:hypothetical protein